MPPAMKFGPSNLTRQGSKKRLTSGIQVKRQGSLTRQLSAVSSIASGIASMMPPSARRMRSGGSAAGSPGVRSPGVRRTRSGKLFMPDPESAVRWVQAATSVPLAHEHLGGVDHVQGHEAEVASAVVSAFDEKLHARRARGGGDASTTDRFVKEAMAEGEQQLRMLGAPSEEELERALQAKLVDKSNATPAARAQRRATFAAGGASMQ